MRLPEMAGELVQFLQAVNLLRTSLRVVKVIERFWRLLQFVRLIIRGEPRGWRPIVVLE